MAIWTLILCSAMAAADDRPVIKVDAGTVLHRLSPFLYGACIEDVNHEIYGGLYSQMIFGESFQEPPRPLPVKGFTAYAGEWTAKDGELRAEAGDGPKLVADVPAFADGEVAVEILLPGEQGGNAGLIVKVDEPGNGADAFTGYEVSLETSGKLVLSRHRKNWEHLRTVPCAVPPDRWIKLAVKVGKSSIEVLVDGKSLLTYEDVAHPLASGRIGLRTWQRPARYRNLEVKSGDDARRIAFESDAKDSPEHHVSGMWDAIARGSAKGEYRIDTRDPFVGRQSQTISFGGGEGEVGVENRGLNRRGMAFVADKPYEGYLWARADEPAAVSVMMIGGDDKTVLARATIRVTKDYWARYAFALTPVANDPKGRLSITLTKPASVTFGHAFLQPGEWGRFKGLPDRKDVTEALIDQGLTVLRYGGSMVNHPEYRWKTMIGPRDKRPPTAGTWYPYSSNGWGIFDFLNVCEKAGFLAIPAVNMGESPMDMADFVEYANGPADSEWGRKRAADGHPRPYGLKHVELGNEEAVNEEYWRKFRPIAEAMWAKDPALILIVGDFAYNRVIDDPYKFEGGVAVNTLSVHKKILDLAKERGREVWFDIHVSTDHPPEPNGLRPERSYIEQLGKIAPGAKYKVVIFEYNSGNHAMKRALSNALATNEVERIGNLLPIACSANCLQPDKQNDNGWDQGLLFLNPEKVWLQPPGYVTRMTRTEGSAVAGQVRGGGPCRDAERERQTERGRQVAGFAGGELGRRECSRATEARGLLAVETGGGGRATFRATRREEHGRAARSDQAEHVGMASQMVDGEAVYTFPPRSLTMIRLE